MLILIKKIILFVIIVLFLPFSTVLNISADNSCNNSDFDPLIDIKVTVEIKGIRFLEEKLGMSTGVTTFRDKNINDFINWLLPYKANIDDNPSFFVKVFINDVEFQSNIWIKTKYIYNPDWSTTLNVPDDQEIVNIKIQLWDSSVSQY